MAVRVDPEGNETRALFGLAELDGHDVLEIGCGDGRLTWRYASRGAHVIAIDPYEGSVIRAKASVPEDVQDRVQIIHADFERFAASSVSSAFDTVILSWALCWMDHEGMVHALESIHRLLKAHGSLLDIHPVPDVARIKVLNTGSQLFSELYPSESGDDFRAADRAIELIVERGLFRLDRSTVFDFLTHASSSTELKDFFETADAYDKRPHEGPVEALRADIYSRADQMINTAGPAAELVYHEVVRIAHLEPVT